MNKTFYTRKLIKKLIIKKKNEENIKKLKMKV